MGKLGVSCVEGRQRNIYNLGHVLVVFRIKWAPNDPPPPGPQWSHMDNLVFHEKLRYKIALWDDSTMGNWVLVPWKVVKGISDDLRHALVIF